MTASDAETLIAKPKETYDGAIPSGNSAAAMVLQKLADLTGEGEWQDAADRQMKFMEGRISAYPASSCLGILAMMDALYPPHGACLRRHVLSVRERSLQSAGGFGFKASYNLRKDLGRISISQ